MNAYRTISRFFPVVLLTMPGVSCVSDCRTGNDSSDILRGVPIPPERAVELLATEAPLAAGQTLRRQSYTIYEDGEFVLDRSIEASVGALGARCRALDPKAAQRAGVEAFAGVLVSSVHSSGAAEKAGLRPDDVIVSCDGKPIASPEQLLHYVEAQDPGAEVAIEFFRQGDRTAATVELGEEKRVESVREWRRKLRLVDEQERLGMTLAELTPEVRALVVGTDGPGAAEDGSALMVVDILPGGPAFEADVRVRDIVSTVDATPTTTPEDWTASLRESTTGEQLALGVWRSSQSLEASPTPTENATGTKGFDFINLIRYRRRPSRTEFSLVWELLYYSESCRAVEELNGEPFHRRSNRWGAVLGLIHWYSSPEMSELRLLWLLPIRIRNE